MDLYPFVLAICPFSLYRTLFTTCTKFLIAQLLGSGEYECVNNISRTILASSLAKVPIRFSPLALGGFKFSYAFKTTALTPSGIRELSFLTSVL